MATLQAWSCFSRCVRLKRYSSTIRCLPRQLLLPKKAEAGTPYWVKKWLVYMYSESDTHCINTVQKSRGIGKLFAQLGANDHVTLICAGARDELLQLRFHAQRPLVDLLDISLQLRFQKLILRFQKLILSQHLSSQHHPQLCCAGYNVALV